MVPLAVLVAQAAEAAWSLPWLQGQVAAEEEGVVEEEEQENLPRAKAPQLLLVEAAAVAAPTQTPSAQE